MNRSALAILLVGFACFTGSASATPLLTDSFDNLVGWNVLGTASSGASGLIYSGKGLTEDGGGRALYVSGNNSATISRHLLAPLPSTFYVSFLFEVVAGSVNNNDFASFWFDNTTTGDHTGVPNVGYKANEGGSGTKDLMARTSLNGGTAYSTNITPGTTYLVVAEFSKTSGSASYNSYKLWVNPGLSGGAPDAQGTFSSGLTNINYIGLRTTNLSVDDRVAFDELRIGTDFKDVVHMPEPGTMLSLGAGLISLSAIARHRKLF